MPNNKIFNLFYGILVVKFRSRCLNTLHCMPWYIAWSCDTCPVSNRTVSTENDSDEVKILVTWAEEMDRWTEAARPFDKIVHFQLKI